MTIKVELFTAPGCDLCAKARQAVQGMVDALGADRIEWRAVDVLDEIDYAVSLRILSTPAIAVDGNLVFTSLPSLKMLRLELQERLQSETDRGP